MIIMDMSTKTGQVRKRFTKAKYGHLTKKELEIEMNNIRENMDIRTAEIRVDLNVPPKSKIQKLFTYLKAYFKES
jgi:hypothetical protein